MPWRKLLDAVSFRLLSLGLIKMTTEFEGETGFFMEIVDVLRVLILW